MSSTPIIQPHGRGTRKGGGERPKAPCSVSESIPIAVNSWLAEIWPERKKTREKRKKQFFKCRDREKKKKSEEPKKNTMVAITENGRDGTGKGNSPSRGHS